MATMTKKQLVGEISKKLGLNPNEVRPIVQHFLDLVTETLAKGDRIEFRDFGIFEVVLRKKKIGRNPKQPEQSIVIPERHVVKFSEGKKMKEGMANLRRLG